MVPISILTYPKNIIGLLVHSLVLYNKSSQFTGTSLVVHFTEVSFQAHATKIKLSVENVVLSKPVVWHRSQWLASINL